MTREDFESRLSTILEKNGEILTVLNAKKEGPHSETIERKIETTRNNLSQQIDTLIAAYTTDGDTEQRENG